MEWVLGLILLVIVLTALCAYFEIIDPVQVLQGALELFAAFVSFTAAFVIWMLRRLRQSFTPRPRNK